MKLDAVFFKKQLPVLLAVVIGIMAMRSSIIEPFRIPTRSMLPGLMMGDFLFVNKMDYGFHIPFSESWGPKPWYLGSTSQPKRGDVIIFTPPEAGQESLYIKRVIGLPGDKIEFVGKKVLVNGVEEKRTEIIGGLLAGDTHRRLHAGVVDEGVVGVGISDTVNSRQQSVPLCRTIRYFQWCCRNSKKRTQHIDYAL